MFGPYMLIAPVLYENQTAREVYLPSGCIWTALQNGQVYQGGQTISTDAPLAEIPVFLKNNAIAGLTESWKNIRREKLNL